MSLFGDAPVEDCCNPVRSNVRQYSKNVFVSKPTLLKRMDERFKREMTYGIFWENQYIAPEMNLPIDTFRSKVKKEFDYNPLLM